ncbi:Rap1a/Tai family immunity protein [Sphingomonas sp. Y38-1Y]|uniref:Rap1a/Tai family immunity protein n=1 Tax=Sphingomonas sp. Y38-1Y TaxID=3078265 RepID=UPI0028E547FA|nr:Rap1a/Tai family immunity protein [Sphingomonas sp. Y38-1Y]
MLAALLAAALAGQTTPAPTPTPAPAPATFLSAGNLLDRCKSNAVPDASYCFAYVAGVHDAVRAYESWLNLREFCTPAGTPQGELRSAFVDYLERNPGFASGEAASVVVVAIKTRYPCIGAPPPKPPAR